MGAMRSLVASVLVAVSAFPSLGHAFVPRAFAASPMAPGGVPPAPPAVESMSPEVEAPFDDAVPDTTAEGSPSAEPSTSVVPSTSGVVEEDAALDAARSTASPARSALHSQASTLLDAYGGRPANAPALRLEEIIEYALQNPLVQAAKQDVVAMEAQVKKTRFAWIPVISTEMTLMPGANITCDTFTLFPSVSEAGDVAPLDFQYCRSQRNENEVYNLNRVTDYFSQLSKAGVRFEFKASTVIPITTFGKLINLKKLAKVGLDLKRLEQMQMEHETIVRVHQAFTTLMLARESLAILQEAEGISKKAIGRVRADLGGDSDEDWDQDLDDEPDAATNLARDPADLFKTELAGVEIAELSLQARRIEAVSLSALWALAGRAAPRGFDISQPRQPLYAIPGGLQDVQAYKEEALRNRPEAKMAAAAVLARHHQERIARANFLPDLGILLSFGVARSNAADPNIREFYYNNSLNYSRLTIALAMRWKWDFHMKAFDLQAARAVERSATFQNEAARLLLAQEVEQAYRELVEATHDIDLEREAVDLSWKLVVAAQQKDTVGGGDAGELVKYLETWYRRRFELAEAIQHHNLAVARLSRAVGSQLVDPAEL